MIFFQLFNKKTFILQNIHPKTSLQVFCIYKTQFFTLSFSTKNNTIMRGLYGKLKKDLGLTLILAIGLSVEFSNFQSMFYRFMLQYRHDWGGINHIPAIFLSAFLLLCIVIFGIRKQTALSWFLAMLTCVISFAVYSRMGLRWNWASLSEVHFVVVILSGMLPMLVAYTTHQIAQDTDPEFKGKDEREMENLMDQIRKMYGTSGGASQNGRYNGFNGHYSEDDKKKNTPIIDEVETLDEKTAQKIRRQRKQKTQTPKSQHHAVMMYALPQYEVESFVEQEMKNAELLYQIVDNEEFGKRIEPIFVPKMETIFEKYETTAKHSSKAETQVKTEKTIDKTVEKSAEKAEKNTEIESETNSAVMGEKEVEMEVRHHKNCDHCGKELSKKNKNARYCSNVCRLVAIKSKKKSDFYTLNDEFDQSGFIEWVNPDFA